MELRLRWLLWASSLVLTSLMLGLFAVPLFGNDAPEYASIAATMYRSGDWIHLVNRGQDFLDKPHVVFWMAAASFSVFGPTDWAYRLPSVLVSLLGAYSVFRLGKLLRNAQVGLVAALMFESAYAISLGNHDVRMEAALCGFLALAVWKLLEGLLQGSAGSALIGGIALGLAFGTKGMLPVLLAGFIVLFFLWQRRASTRLSLKWAAASCLGFIFAALPVVYSYYRQFDAIAGQPSALGYIFWGQNFERFAGREGWHFHSELGFFWHTLLWAFLPWSTLLFFAGIELWRNRRSNGMPRSEMAFLALACAAVLLIVDFSQFKLPHYINILIPFLSLVVAEYVVDQEVRFSRLSRWAMWVQTGVAITILAGLIMVNGWLTPAPPWIWALTAAAMALLAWQLRDALRSPSSRLWLPTFGVAVLFECLLIGNFYRQLAKYQSGPALAAVVQRMGIPASRVIGCDNAPYSFDFHLGHSISLVALSELNARINNAPVYCFTPEDSLREMQSHRFHLQVLAKAPDAHLSMLKWKFLMPSTRDSAYPYAYLVELKP